MNAIADLLKEKKLKLTPQRLAIYHILYNTNTHPTAETIYKSLSETHPSMSFATVYKTLDSLRQAGLVQELNVGEDRYRYDANCTPHMHLVCDGCHEVFDIPYLESIDALKSEISEKTDFDLRTEQFYFYGLCPNCKDQSNHVHAQ